MVRGSSLASLLIALSSIACGSEGASTGDEQDIKTGGCPVVDRDGNALSASVRADIDDAFFLSMLAKGSGACPTTADDTLERMRAIFGVDEFRSVVVSELADEEKTSTPYRFVVVPGSDKFPQGELFLSVGGTPKGGLAQELVEAMGFSPSKQAYAFYAVRDGGWQRVGDASEISPESPKPFECVSCHPTGGPNMKELASPWNNWSGVRSTKMAKSSKPGFDLVASVPVSAYALETIIEEAAAKAVKGYVDRLLDQKQLKGLLRHVMCDVAEPTFVSSAAQNQHRFEPYAGPNATLNIPRTLLIDPLLETGGFGFIKGDAYDAAVKSVAQKFGSGSTADTMFALFAPERSFIDVAIVKELQRKKRLTDDMIKDLLVTDFTNPVFSQVRCALAETAPDAGANAEAVRTAWIANLQASTLPGAAELEARLEDTGDAAAHDGATSAFAAACSARVDDAAAYALDLVRLASQRRLELEEAHPEVVESEFLLPVATSKAPRAHELTLDPTSCKLVAQKN